MHTPVHTCMNIYMKYHIGISPSQSMASASTPSKSKNITTAKSKPAMAGKQMCQAKQTKALKPKLTSGRPQLISADSIWTWFAWLEADIGSFCSRAKDHKCSFMLF